MEWFGLCRATAIVSGGIIVCSMNVRVGMFKCTDVQGIFKGQGVRVAK